MKKLSEYTKEEIDHVLINFDFTELNLKYPSTGFDLHFNEKIFPVKNVIRALRILAGDTGNLGKIKMSSSVVKKKLLEMDYIIKDKEDKVISDENNLTWIIEKYIQYINQKGLSEEIYKWKLCKEYRGFLDVPPTNFYDYIYKTNFQNLVYHSAISVARSMAKKESEDYSRILQNLGNSEENLQTRIISFIRDSKKLNEKYDTVNGSHHDERTASTFLAYHDANQYPLYQNSFYNELCKTMGISKAKPKYRYVHYTELLKDFIDNYIIDNSELLSIIQNYKTDDCHEDKNHLILAQDILRTVLETIIKQNLKIEPTDNKTSPKMRSYPLNQILYGPPGTGKTYEAITLALDILKVKYEKTDRKDVIKNYKKEQEKGNVVFTTFHQSMGYEDFVEGIKPVLIDASNNSSTKLNYEIKPGILMQMAANASYENFNLSRENANDLSFDKVYELYIQHLQLLIDEGNPKVINTITGFPIIIDRINRNDSIVTLYKSQNNISRSRPKRKPHLRKLFNRINNISEIKNVKDIAEIIETRGGMSSYWAVFNDLLAFKKNLNQREINEEGEEVGNDKIIQSYKNGEYNDVLFTEDSPGKVIIIDEINRGNVSAIFGELITLLEEDKRIGAENEILTSLPYSPDASFGLPPNLYIIGTMNTADRSVEALDTALRRRFEFTEKLSRPDILMTENNKGQKEFYGFTLSDILSTINSRIEALIDRDHTIGHSYFFKLKNEKALYSAFLNKIIPLLQEYFYNDYSKIGLVLGSGFITEEKGTNESIFAKFDTDSSIHNSYDSPEAIYRLKEITFNDFQKALTNLMN